MTSIQIIKRVNQTEIGKGGTHETYILVPQQLDVSEIFPPNQLIPFFFPDNQKEYSIRLTIGREKRIVGLGDFYRDSNIMAGDSVILEKIFRGENIRHIIRCQHYPERIILQRQAQGFELLSGDISNINSSAHRVIHQGLQKVVNISFLRKEKKRNDSPIETTFYDMTLDGNSSLGEYANKELVEIILMQGVAHIDRFCSWEKHNIETE